jgi:hypothetical protein
LNTPAMAPVRPEPSSTRVRTRTSSFPSRSANYPLTSIRRTRTSVQDVDRVGPLPLPAQASLPTLQEYNIQEADFIASMPPDERASLALIDETMYRDIWAVIHDPLTAQRNPRYPPAFLDWVRAAFTAEAVVPPPGTILCHNKRPVARRDNIYEILCVSHLKTLHGGSDKTAALIYSAWSYVPVELVHRFVTICPTCNRARLSSFGGTAEATSNPSAGVHYENTPPSPRSFLATDSIPDIQGWDGPTTTLPSDQMHIHEIAQSIFNSRFLVSDNTSPLTPYNATVPNPQQPHSGFPLPRTPSLNIEYPPNVTYHPLTPEPLSSVRSISRIISRPTFHGLIGGQRTPSYGSAHSTQSSDGERTWRKDDSQIDPALLAEDESRLNVCAYLYHE